jgi:SAM-dependent methyltransferase
MSDESWVEVSCPVCGSNRYDVYTHAPSHYGPEKLKVTRCSDCSMVFTNPQLRTYEDNVAERGLLKRHLDPAALDSARRNARLQLRLLSRFGEVRRLLDFGCGSGALVIEARNDGIDAIGLDLNRGQIEAANAHWQFDALQSQDVHDFAAAAPDPFDAIISNQVFEHLQQPLDVGKVLVGMLKPGGLLYVDVPYVYQPGEWFSRGKTLDPTAHWCHFSGRTLGRLVESLGCEVVFWSASPALIGTWHRLKLARAADALGVWCKRLLPPVGSGVCVIAQRA